MKLFSRKSGTEIKQEIEEEYGAKPCWCGGKDYCIGIYPSDCPYKHRFVMITDTVRREYCDTYHRFRDHHYQEIERK